MPGGSIIDTVYRRAERLDLGQQSGVSMSFYDWDRSVVDKQAVRIRKPFVSEEDHIRAKVDLYRWWLLQKGILV